MYTNYIENQILGNGLINLANNDFIIIEPGSKTGTPGRLLSLSASVRDDRIRRVLGSDVSIWRITVKSNNYFLKTRSQLFRIPKVNSFHF